MPRTIAIGVVTGDRTDKTRRVEIPRLVRHPKYGKYIRRRTVCYVHDENNESAQGDTVEISACRPRSKMKRWELVRVVSKSRLVDVAAMRAAARAERQQPEQAESDE
jgi:small subunit ribosomal protein S17